MSNETRGADVKLLQSELVQLGLTIVPTELEKQQFGPSTYEAVLAFQRQHARSGLQATGIVDERTALLINQAVDALHPGAHLLVRGVVRQQDNRVLPSVVVRALERGMRSETLLGEAKTDNNGYYEITYTADQIQRAEPGPPDLLVRAFNAQNELLAASSILFDAPPVATIDVVVPPRPEPPRLSEYEQLLKEITPILEGVTLADLTNQDLDFLFGETQIDRQHLGFLPLSAKLSVQTSIPTEAFYGWARQSIPPSLDSILPLPDEELRRAMESAIAENIVPAKLRDSLADILNRIDQLRAKKAFDDEQKLVPHEIQGQLLNQETGAALTAGIVIHAFDLDAGPQPKDLGQERTSGQGLFALVYRAPNAPPPAAAVGTGRRLRLEIPLDPAGKNIFQTEVRAEEDKLLQIQVPVPPVVEPPSPHLEELNAVSQVQLPQNLLTFLAQRNITTLADVRKAGGVSSLAGLPMAADSESVRMLEAHANLSMLSSDVKANAQMIAKGYDSISAVATASRPTFVGNLHTEIGDVQAAKYQVMARAQMAFMHNVIAAGRVNIANGFRPHGDTAASPTLQLCQCKDCEAAVSPIAYLADLLDYALKHVLNAGATMKLSDLVGQFYQPFDQLLASCKDSDRQVRQVRLCIEVLRRFLKANHLSLSQTEEVNYLSEAYQLLLLRVGASYDDLRLASSADDQFRISLAERLGIELIGTRPNDCLDALLLDATLPNPDPKALTEEALERLFGLVNTDPDQRNPLSDGITRDTSNQIQRWSLDGVQWGVNTDSNGIIYVSVKKANGNFRLELCRDAQRTQLVASGQVSQSTDPLNIVEENSSGLSGRVELAYSSDNAAIEFVALPQLLAWRLGHLRTLWKTQDRQTNLYLDMPSDLTDEQKAELPPVIDPDVIGPDDFRSPFLKVNAAAPDRPFDIWYKRRVWVNAQLDVLKKLNNDFTNILNSLYTPVQYGAFPSLTPWANTTSPDDLDTLVDGLAAPSSAQQAKERLAKDLLLTPDSFSRLMVLRGKDERGDKITNDEWDEIYSILVQSQKLAFFPVWRNEEGLQNLHPMADLGPEHYWVSQRRPKEGNWPPAAQLGPVVDPDLLKQDELPEPTVGRRVLAMWRSRRVQIDQIKQNLKSVQKKNRDKGFDAILREALGDPLPFDLGILNVSLPGDQKKITDVLHITADDFTRLVFLKVKNDDTSPQRQPLADAEWEDVFTILTSAQKQRASYPAWATEEQQAGLQYWQMLKAKLPLWRAPADTRQEWQRALRMRSQAPIVDPHVIGPGDLRDPVKGDASYDLREARGEDPGAWSNTTRAGLEQARQAALTELAGIDAVLIKALFSDETFAGVQAEITSDRTNNDLNYVFRQVWGDPLPDLKALLADQAKPETRAAIAASLYLTTEDFQTLMNIQAGSGSAAQADTLLARAVLVKSVIGLDEQNRAGNDITAALDQLSLTIEAFAFLVRMRGIAVNTKLGDSEWLDVENILVQAQKRRNFAQWRDDERTSNITLGPDYFKFPDIDPTTFPPQPPVQVTKWLAARDDRISWQDTLQARIDQQKSVTDDIAQAVSSTEEAVLPNLRDYLVWMTNSESDLAAKAEWVTDHLLIDAKNDGCQLTTRVSQAIETIQGLVFGIRTGELQEAFPNFVLEADYFEEEWQWVGSYAMWRAAMFVFLYPENILIPSLLKEKTPAFRKLINDLRSNRNLTPGRACDAAKQYSEYLRDVCNLTIETSCQAKTLVHRAQGCDSTANGYVYLFYMFARSGKTDRLYWSSYEAPPSDGNGTSSSSYSQTFWALVPGFESAQVVKVLGAVPYQVIGGQRFLFLFVQVEEKGKQKLLFTRYDLEKQVWDQEPEDNIDLPKEDTRDTVNFTAVVKQQDQEEKPPHLVLRLPRGSVYGAYFNDDGSALRADWSLIIGPHKGSEFSALLALIEVPNGGWYYDSKQDLWVREHFLFLQHQSDNDVLIYYRLFGDWDDGVWRSPYLDNFKGAFSWPNSMDVYLVDGAILHRADAPVGQQSFGPLADLNGWLSDSLGLNLNMLAVPAGVEHNNVPYEGWGLYDFLTNTAVDANWDSTEHRQKNFDVIDKLADHWLNDDKPEWQEWKLADQMVLEFSGIDLDLAIKRGMDAVHGWPTSVTNFRYRGGAVEASWISTGTPGDSVAPTCWSVDETDQDSFQKLFAYNIRKGIKGGVYRCTFDRADDSGLSEVDTARVAPSIMFVQKMLFSPIPLADNAFTDPYQIASSMSGDDRQFRRQQMSQVYLSNEGDGPRSNLNYFDEAYYFVPIHLALQLQAAGQYNSALDWFRIVYDYSVTTDQRKIWYGLQREESLPATYDRTADWLLDPLNPHSIAGTREDTYTRFTILALVRCLLGFADAEFTRDTAESVPRARMLYLTALELLDVPELNQSPDPCESLIGQLKIDVGGPPWAPVIMGTKKSLSAIKNPRVLAGALNGVNEALNSGDSLSLRFEKAKEITNQAKGSEPATATLGQALEREQAIRAGAQTALLTQSLVVHALNNVSHVTGNDFLRAVAAVSKVSFKVLESQKVEMAWLRDSAATIKSTATRDFAIGVRSIPNGVSASAAPTSFELPETAQLNKPYAGLKKSQKWPVPSVPGPSVLFCVPPNPILQALRLHAELNLYKIRSCRNIAGMERQLDPYSAPTDTISGLPTIGMGGQLVLPGTIALQPTLYRYSTLIERAKQLVGLAQQVETAYLSALEKRDAEAYTQLKARQDLQVARAGVRLHDLQVKQAQDGVGLAELQQEKAQEQFDHYSALLDDSLVNTFEIEALVFMFIAFSLQNAAAGFSAGVGDVGGALSSAAQANQTAAQIFSTMASLELRKEDWQFQRELAQQDIKIGEQQVKIANDQVQVAGQERTIAVLQSDHAQGTIDFLSNKFTNVELYDWMSGVLQGVYSFFLQQATAVAQLAANQLAFERQEVPPPYIQSDYWDAPSDNTGDGQAPDRRGLTGSVRLQQDIYQLDRYAFDTDKRKLQLSKTISLAQMAPTEFQRFRESGVLPFATPMEIFDRDFPGHYLRTIRRVKTSVVALIPPNLGIRATLSTLGTSRVVIGGDVFQTVLVKRSPEQVALSSPRDATGLFDLDIQPDMLPPFEGTGVDTHWEFRMAKAGNLFDYSTIADVLVTIDYTALNSFDYQQQVIQSLRPTISADRGFSFRYQFADQWYDLHNPEQTSTPMAVTFQTTSQDFPPNLSRLKIQQVTMYFARADGKTFETPVTQLQFNEQAGGGPVGGGAVSIDGIISTRNGNGGSWAAMLDSSPFGEWMLVLPNTGEIKNRFKNEEIQDILFVVTYSGRVPDWPA